MDIIMDKINIAYTINNQNIYHLIVSVQSIISNNKNNDLNFYIVYDEEFEEFNLKEFEKFKSSNCKFRFIKEDSLKFQKIKGKVNFNERFYCADFPNLIDADKILYFTSYTLINTNLSELWNTNLDGYSCASAEYMYNSIYDQYKVKKEISFHNTVVLIDLNKWRQNNIFDRVLNTNYSKFSTKPINAGVCFNLLVGDECKKLDISYNYSEANESWNKGLEFSCSKETIEQYKNIQLHLESPKIITFCVETPLGKKECHNSYLNLWWKYAEQTPIYEDIKNLRNLNKYKLSSTSAQNSFKYSWLLSRIFPYIKPYWFRILIGFLIAIPLGLLDGVTALALKPYMDYVIGGKTFEFSVLKHTISINSIQMAFIIPLGVILFAAFQGVLRYLNSYISSWTSQRITNDVKFALFHRLIHMHPQFFDDNSSGIIISRYMSDPKTASAGIVDRIKTMTTSLCGALGLIAVMIYSSWKLAFVGVFVLCVAFIPVILIRNRIKKASNENMVIGGKITTNINETYSGNKVMASYDLQDRQENNFIQYVWESFRINMSLTKRTAWMSPLMYQIASIGIAIVLGYGTYLINTHQMTAGSFASFVTSLLLLYKPVKTLGNTLTGIQNLFVAMGRVFELFDLEPAIKEKENPIELKEFKNNIEFKKVCFEYVPSKPVLKDISLTSPKNETLAIVGNSGGGKSTLVNLIPRFYDIKSGSLTIDGISVKDFSLSSLRRNISMVFQDNFLYSGTIKDNILMGKPDATTDELMKVIEMAHLQDMVEDLPEGLETEIGERGLTLSGGQRQRVAIARALLKDAPIVILDEATSALDNESEAIVQKAMDNLMKNRTVFIIAHRLSTIKNADRIAVINEGKLAELGTHEELMSIENGEYKHLYEMQFRTQEEK